MLEQSLRDLLNEVGKVCGRVGRELEAEPYQVAIVSLFDRCRSMFGAVRVLLDHDFAQEAVVLGRPLFTESLMLTELADLDEPRRVALVVGWWLAGLTSLEGIVREGIALGDDGDELAAIAARRDELQRYVADRGVKSRPFPQEKDLARTHGRAREYLDFRLTHHFVHGTAMAAEERLTKRADGTYVVGGPGADVETWAPPAGLFAATSLLLATRAVCRIFGWQEPPELPGLLRKCDDVIVELNRPGESTDSRS
ncbi:MAG: hypothetical protein WBP81_37475 [Solirubrobacteraceae bacterium]